MSSLFDLHFETCLISFCVYQVMQYQTIVLKTDIKYYIDRIKHLAIYITD